MPDMGFRSLPFWGRVGGVLRHLEGCVNFDIPNTSLVGKVRVFYPGSGGLNSQQDINVLPKINHLQAVYLSLYYPTHYRHSRYLSTLYSAVAALLVLVCSLSHKPCA